MKSHILLSPDSDKEVCEVFSTLNILLYLQGHLWDHGLFCKHFLFRRVVRDHPHSTRMKVKRANTIPLNFHLWPLWGPSLNILARRFRLMSNGYASKNWRSWKMISYFSSGEDCATQTDCGPYLRYTSVDLLCLIPAQGTAHNRFDPSLLWMPPLQRDIWQDMNDFYMSSVLYREIYSAIYITPSILSEGECWSGHLVLHFIMPDTYTYVHMEFFTILWLHIPYWVVYSHVTHAYMYIRTADPMQFYSRFYNPLRSIPSLSQITSGEPSCCTACCATGYGPWLAHLLSMRLWAAWLEVWCFLWMRSIASQPSIMLGLSPLGCFCVAPIGKFLQRRTLKTWIRLL